MKKINVNNVKKGAIAVKDSALTGLSGAMDIIAIIGAIPSLVVMDISTVIYNGVSDEFKLRVESEES